MNLVRKLLHQQLGWHQLTGFFMAGMIGILIVLLGVQIWADTRTFFNDEEGFVKKDYLIVTKKVGALSILNKQSGIFSSKEEAELKQQPFVGHLGRFTSSRFKVSAGIEIKSMGISFGTEMFFESVPEEFVDVRTPQWKFEKESGVIPIVLPKNYLNLYNFGFAQARNLPKLSEGLLEMVDFDIRISGNGKRGAYKGKIVGFSNRLNTILVPEDFLLWANRQFSENPTEQAARLIIEVAGKGSQEMAEYFRNNGYETENNKQDDGRVGWLLNFLIVLVLFIGLLISILSFYLLITSMYLLLQKNSEKIKNLLLLGYGVNEVAKPYRRIVLILNSAVTVTALLIAYLIRRVYLPFLEEIWPDFSPGNFGRTLLCALLLFVLISTFHILSIQRKIKNL